tara:strand:- start:175 stop:579 length:405 start_codon:yes stop_codon:yes gene_type:complete
MHIRLDDCSLRFSYSLYSEASAAVMVPRMRTMTAQLMNAYDELVKQRPREVGSQLFLNAYREHPNSLANCYRFEIGMVGPEETVVELARDLIGNVDVSPEFDITCQMLKGKEASDVAEMFGLEKAEAGAAEITV